MTHNRSSVTAAVSITQKEARSRFGVIPSPSRAAQKSNGNRPVDQAEAAARFIAAPEHEKMHDERLWAAAEARSGIASYSRVGGTARARLVH